MSNPLPSGPTPETIVGYILETYPETDVVEAMDAWFFSLDAEKHWPNYATIVTTDAHDDASDLSRPERLPVEPRRGPTDVREHRRH